MSEWKTEGLIRQEGEAFLRVHGSGSYFFWEVTYLKKGTANRVKVHGTALTVESAKERALTVYHTIFLLIELDTKKLEWRL